MQSMQEKMDIKKQEPKDMCKMQIPILEQEQSKMKCLKCGNDKAFGHDVAKMHCKFCGSTDLSL